MKGASGVIHARIAGTGIMAAVQRLRDSASRSAAADRQDQRITDRRGCRVGTATLIRDTPHVVRHRRHAIGRGTRDRTDYVFDGTHSLTANGER